jgi:hypothetical protein
MLTTSGVDDHSTVGYIDGSLVVIAVADDVKSIATFCITVLLSNVTVIAKPDGYVFPDPCKSPIATIEPSACT